MAGVQVRRAPVAIAAALAALVLTAVGVLSAVGAGALVVVLARAVVTPPRKREHDIRIIAADLDAAEVTLASTPDSVLPGEYSLWFGDDGGHARIGEIIGTQLPASPTSPMVPTVTRQIVRVDFGDLGAAGQGRLSGWCYLGPWDLGLDYENVIVPTPVGAAPAWLIPAAEPSTHWVIQVHGRAVRRQEGLRAVPVFREAGYTSLLVSYRNDGDAPAGDDGRYGLGDTEWRDIDEAIAFARDRGAATIILMGWSMGGAIALQTATRSSHREVIRGIVLDSPVIDWRDVVSFQAAARRLPAIIPAGAVRLMGSRWGGRLTGQRSPIDFARLDFVTRAQELSIPILLMHSDDDGYVPAMGSRTLARDRPDIVTFVPFAVARHTKLWNYDPARWNGAIRRWLAGLK